MRLYFSRRMCLTSVLTSVWISVGQFNVVMILLIIRTLSYEPKVKSYTYSDFQDLFMY